MGQVNFGKRELYRKLEASDRADLWVLEGFCCRATIYLHTTVSALPQIVTSRSTTSCINQFLMSCGLLLSGLLTGLFALRC